MEKDKSQPGTKWLTKQDVMKYLSASKRAIENYMADGKLRFYRFEGRVFFDEKEVDQDIRGRKSSTL